MHKVVSGGQTGADRIGLNVAKASGITTGGWAPKGWKTEKGPDPSLKDFGLKQADSGDYDSRTILNVRDSDGTVLFGDMSSPGSLATIRACKNQTKPYLTNPVDGNELSEWIQAHGIGVLNVAGNRGSKLDSLKELKIAGTLKDAFAILGYKS